MIALLLAFTLHWSAVRTNAGPDCTSSVVQFSVPITYHVHRLRQSAFWLAHRDSMLDNRTPYFTAHWAQVKQEAEPVTVAVTSDTSVTLPDSAGFYYVTAVKPSGAESCRGNLVGRP